MLLGEIVKDVNKENEYNYYKTWQILASIYFLNLVQNHFPVLLMQQFVVFLVFRLSTEYIIQQILCEILAFEKNVGI